MKRPALPMPPACATRTVVICAGAAGAAGALLAGAGAAGGAAWAAGAAGAAGAAQAMASASAPTAQAARASAGRPSRQVGRVATSAGVRGRRYMVPSLGARAPHQAAASSPGACAPARLRPVWHRAPALSRAPGSLAPWERAGVRAIQWPRAGVGAGCRPGGVRLRLDERRARGRRGRRRAMSLDERVAIVTGGGKGIGKHYCQGLAAQGAAVVVAEIDAGAAETTAAELRAAGHRALEAPTDVSDEASVRAMVARTLDTFGRVDILVNNAAIFASVGFTHAPHDQISIAEW